VPLATIRTLENERPITVGIDDYAPTQTQEICVTFPSAREFLTPASARRLAEVLVALANSVQVAKEASRLEGPRV
jgi:hypothetical protein